MVHQQRSNTASVVVVVALVFWVGVFGASAQSPEEVNAAIDRGVNLLKRSQRPDGSWSEFGQHHGGATALHTLALLSCDVPVDDPVIQRALGFLRTVQVRSTYVVALQTMVFAEANAKQDFAIIKRNAQWLRSTRGPAGSWSYGPRQADGDNSNTQFALLGLQAAADANAEIPDNFWEGCREHWIQGQTRQGGWSYHRGGGAPTGSMTVAGISSLMITSRFLPTVRKGIRDGQALRCQGPRDDRALDAGLGWLSRNFSVERNPPGAAWHYYYLYGLERAGRLTGRRFFGDHDWYREGVRLLLRQQALDGNWRGDNMATPFALLFLSKGRIPLLVGKLHYGLDRDWNNAPNDVHNLTRFMAKLWNRKLNWQIVEMRLANVEDLLQTPVIHFSGQQLPTFTPREKKALRDYVEQGGVLVADANCGVRQFDDGFRALCREIFPEPGQELRPLEPEHGVWNSLFNLPPVWPLHGINIGCRTAVFYSPDDLSCHWEHEKDKNSLPAFRLGANIVAYAVGPQELRDKLDKREVVVDKSEDEIRRNFLHVAKIRHNGDWNLAPRAVRHLMASLREMAKIDVIQQQREIEILDTNLFNYPLSYMHGRTKFVLNRKEHEALREYLNNGGVLFSDACCGSAAFDQAFRELMVQLFPNQKLEPIPPQHELYSRSIGYDLSTVKYTRVLGDREGVPELEGIKINDRYAVIYSKYDIGCALERQQSKDCKGYVHESALRIASNVVLYALKQ